ncbi:MAG: NAD(P)H-hydrate dehydratase [Myxococcales bacterium]|nr:NAD(P)H-hydrate dehydratase [Myxococcales bacterium]
MRPVVSIADMLALETALMARGVPQSELMRRAGAGVADVVLARWRQAPAARVVVVCGPGNNGGDGYVVARVVAAAGVPVRVWAVAPPRTEAARTASADAAADGVIARELKPFAMAAYLADVEGALVVDSIFGTGVARAVDGAAAQAIAAYPRAAYVIAVDVPSGINADTGIAAAAVRADMTVACGAYKLAHAVSPGLGLVGIVRFADIGLSPAETNAVARAQLISPRDAAAWLPREAAEAHKGVRGHVLCVGGGPGMRGAGRLAAYGALRAGAGTVVLVAPDNVEVRAPAPVMTSWAQDAALWTRPAHACVVGPGLGRDADAIEALARALRSDLPLVIDADALNLLAAGEVRMPAARRDAGVTVLTPHPGEAARLLDLSVAEVQADRVAAALALAARFRVTAVLKGEGTVIAHGARVLVVAAHVPALATAGSGDVLAGVLASLLAQAAAAPRRDDATGLGLPSHVSVVAAGVGLHAQAGALMGRRLGARGATALDIVRYLPRARVSLLTRLPPATPAAII